VRLKQHSSVRNNDDLFLEREIRIYLLIPTPIPNFPEIDVEIDAWEREFTSLRGENSI